MSSQSRPIAVALGALLVASCALDADTSSSSTQRQPVETTVAGTSTSNQANEVRVLVFYETEGFEHESIAAGLDAFEQLSSELDFDLTATNESEIFISDELK
ncbi:MAG: hypothetical protein PVJ28_10545, partial [Acidimicrobiia bacterium]